MDQPHKVYIALGSNKGDRLKHLQDAINLIFSDVGKINIISKVYNTPALGFENDASTEDFLNACVFIDTYFSAEEVMLKLLNIENELGRTRHLTDVYESRTIDLDVIFFDDDVIISELITTPHAQMHKRKFVLQPLHDIAPKVVHPKLSQSVLELLQACKDDSDDIYKSLIFSKITLPEDEFRLYRKLFYLMYKDITKPDLYVYLYQNTERLQDNIKKRGRDYEQNIENDYLDKINSGYLEFLKNQTELNVKIIDISNRDFMENRADYLWVLQEICG